MKTYWLQFGSGDPRTKTGLTPTFLIFMHANGGTATPPGITEMISGTGLYSFQYGPTLGMGFLVDGGATLTSANDRYITGSLDPVQAIDETLNGIGSTLSSLGSTFGGFGSTLVGIGNTLLATGSTLLGIGSTLSSIGSTLGSFGATLSFLNLTVGTTTSSFGSTTADPTSVYGYLKRLQELMEGNAGFDKSTGVWSMYSRGSSTLLREKTMNESVTQVTKT